MPSTSVGQLTTACNYGSRRPKQEVKVESRVRRVFVAEKEGIRIPRAGGTLASADSC